MEFNIGDKVKVRPYDEVSEAIRIRGLAKSAGRVGEIVDVVYSNAKGKSVYKILFDGDAHVSRTDFEDGMIDPIGVPEKPRYEYEFEYLDTVVVARLYEVTEESRLEVAKGHGHIIHDGVYGIAQAASYALKRIYYAIMEGEE